MTSETRPKISVVLPLLLRGRFLKEMTRFCIATLREHADNPFELVIVEAVSNEWSPERDHVEPDLWPDKYLHFPQKIGAVKEVNKGLEAATGDFVLGIGNDVIMPPHWDTELLRVFAERPDCGVASLSCFEPGAIVGPTQPLDMLVEGFYSPIMMFRKGERMDESFIKIYQDSDFILRIYERGQRAYRTCRAIAYHLNRMTNDRVDQSEHARHLAHDEQLFYKRWGKSPLAMFASIRAGGYIVGREHESWLRPINLHYDPTTGEPR